MKLRFAPSPTGLLHVGNAFIALSNALFAIRHGAALLLRIDDTDAERSRAEFAQAIETDLHWLGIAWTEGPIRQSDRLGSYAAAAQRLRDVGRLYPCFETEEELAWKRRLRLKRRQPPVYDREALRMRPEQISRAQENGKTPYWRFRLTDAEIGWEDLVLGSRRVKLPSVSDPVLVRADGSFLYTFTSAVDDLELGVTHVIRGEDHVTNTGVQIDIMQALGGAQPRFGHRPLMVGAEGEKLSKRLESLSLRGLRQDGIEPASVVGTLAALGTRNDPRPGLPAELAAEFDLESVSHASPRFNPRTMLALNARLLRGLDFASVRDRLPEGATEDFWLAVRGNIEMLSEARLWWRVVAGEVVPPPADEPTYLRTALDHLPPAPWDDATWRTWTDAVKTATGRKGRALFHPLRLALTGEESGPEMPALLPLIGPERAAARLALAAGP